MVRKNKRSESRFAVLDICLKLATYTHDILANEKIFDKKYIKIIDRMADEASMIYHLARTANKLRADDVIQLKRRIELQKEILQICEELMTDIMISKGLFHLRASRVQYWGKLTKEAQDAVAAWNISEVKSYKMAVGC